MKNKHGLKVALSIISLGILFIGIYQIAFASTFGGAFFKPAKTSVASTSVQAISNSAQVTEVSNKGTTFTAEELAKYNGMNGNPAYVAVDGIVYDMTQMGSWKNGKHQGLSAGQDLTAEFANSPHSKDILNQSPVVGTLVAQKSETFVATSNNNIANSSKNKTVSKAVSPTSTSSAASSSTSNASASQVWTLDILSQYNGMNGKPAYIAVNGTIYDVTSLGAWSGGVHRGIQAGQDITALFAKSPHSSSILKQAPIIGQLGDVMNSNSIITKSNAKNHNNGNDPQFNDLDDHNDDDDDHDSDHEDEDDDHEEDDHDEDDDDHEDGDD